LACFTKVFAISEELLPDDPRFARVFRFFTLEKGVIAGALLFACGAVLLAWSVWVWKETGFGSLPYAENLRRVSPQRLCLLSAFRSSARASS
jgi:hypothetical protein